MINNQFATRIYSFPMIIISVSTGSTTTEVITTTTSYSSQKTKSTTAAATTSVSTHLTIPTIVSTSTTGGH